MVYPKKNIFCPCDDVTNVTSYIYFAATERVAWQRIILIINFYHKSRVPYTRACIYHIHAARVKKESDLLKLMFDDGS